MVTLFLIFAAIAATFAMGTEYQTVELPVEDL